MGESAKAKGLPHLHEMYYFRIYNILNMKLVHTLLFLVTVSIATSQSKDLAITHVNLFNGYENKIYPDAIVFVKNGKIDRIGKQGDPIDAPYEIIDGLGYYLMPGMLDAHTHIDNLAAAKRALYSGVTTVRTAGVPAYQDVVLGELSRTGKIAGPDFIPAGVFVTPNLGETVLADVRLGELVHGVTTDAALRKIVNVNIDRGAKVIKTRDTDRAGLPDTDPRKQVYTQAQLKVIVDEATKRGVPVMVHAHGDEGARAAVMAGARSIEHGTFLSESTLELMKEKGCYLVLTLITLDDLTQVGGEYDDPVLQLRGNFMVPVAERVLKMAMSIGVKIATGADNNYSEKSTSRIALECLHYVRLGMTPFQAIQAATITTSELLQVDQLTGKIKGGLEADMILVPGNPLEDIRNLQDVLMVISNGQVALKRIPFGKD
jgi:imidazolonepropionase-like amidohydrolase